MNAALQLEFSYQLPAMRPLVPISTAMVLGDQDEDRVQAAIDTGGIPFAWDIRGLAAAAREIRIWRESLIWWLTTRGTFPTVAAQFPDLAAVVARLFPHARDEVKGTELQRMFSCGHSHIINLINDGLLVATTKPGPGPLGSPKITRASVVGLLLQRRVL